MDGYPILSPHLPLCPTFSHRGTIFSLLLRVVKQKSVLKKRFTRKISGMPVASRRWEKNQIGLITWSKKRCFPPGYSFCRAEGITGRGRGSGNMKPQASACAGAGCNICAAGGN
jgi:hypothetical protein